MKITIELDTQQGDDAALLDKILRALAVKDEPPSTEEPSDPTRRVLPIPPGLPPLPPVPEGYDRWVYRGTYWKTDKHPVVYAVMSRTLKNLWMVEKNGSPRGSSDHYIEAIKEGEQ